MTEIDAARFDTIIKGGEVIDPAGGLGGRHDVAITDGRIVEVAADLDPDSAREVIDASGQYVAPGFIDLHTHVYWGVTYWGIEPDPVAARSGVTTWLDVGSAGAYSFPGFREYIVNRSKSRVYSLLNLSAIGLIAPTYEFSNPDYCDVDLAAAIVEANRDVILGIKARIDRETTRGVGIAPLIQARTLADRLGLPLMVHIGQGPPTIAEVGPHLRPGDILTHCFTGYDMRIIDNQGQMLPEIKALHDQGLVLDIGHGTGSFSFETAEALLNQGILPDVISTDIHQVSIQGPMFDMPVTLSKFLNLGMSLPEVIACVTSKPAAILRKPELGTLEPGSPADLALFRIETGSWVFQDAYMKERTGTRRLVSTTTMIAGETLPLLPERPLHPWADLPERQRGKIIPLAPVPPKA